MKSTGKAKKKTLYGRYDDYDLPDEAEESSGAARSADRSRPHAERLTPVGKTQAVTAPKAAPKATPMAAPVPDVPADSLATSDPAFMITRIRPEGEGELLVVTLESRTDDGTRLRRDIPVTVEQYASLGLASGPLTPVQADALAEAGELCLAIRKGMELLGYGDLSARRMVWKLTSRGITKETAVEAAAWLTVHGLIREDDAAMRRAAQDVRKLWGPRRILQDLRAQGYGAEASEAALAALTGADLDPGDELPPDVVDFEVMCAALIRKKFGTVPEDRAERQKMVAALMRLGYDADTIREASRTVMKE